MPRPIRPGISDVIAAYRPKARHELRNEWAMALLYRPIAIVLTPLFVSLSCPPAAVTLLGLLVALALPWAAVSGGEDSALIVGLLGIVCCILDCIDGNVARVTGRTSDIGGYLDFFTDTVYRIAIYASLGLVVDSGSADAMPGWLHGTLSGVAVGLLCALFALVARLCRLYAQASVASTMVESTHADERRLSPAQKLFSFFSGLDHLLPVAIIVFGASGHLSVLLGWLVAYSLADLLLTQRSVLARLG